MNINLEFQVSIFKTLDKLAKKIMLYRVKNASPFQVSAKGQNIQ